MAIYRFIIFLLVALVGAAVAAFPPDGNLLKDAGRLGRRRWWRQRRGDANIPRSKFDRSDFDDAVDDAAGIRKHVSTVFIRIT